MDDGVIKEDKKKIIRILNALFPNVKIYLYGSRARGTHREWSDIDLALDLGRPINLYFLGEAKDVLKESRIFYKVELVDLNAISENFKESIKKDFVLWTE